jgi:hypothetical protein
MLTEKQSGSRSDIFLGAAASTRKLFASGASASASASASTSLIENPIPHVSDSVTVPRFLGTFYILYILHLYNWNRRTALGVQRGSRRPQAAHTVSGPLQKQPWGCFSGGPPAGYKRVGHGGPRWNFRESMATLCHAPPTIEWISFISFIKTNFL